MAEHISYRKLTGALLAGIFSTISGFAILGFLSAPAEVDTHSAERDAKQRAVIDADRVTHRKENDELRVRITGVETALATLDERLAGRAGIRDEQHKAFRRDIERIDGTQDGIIKWTAEEQRREIDKNGH